MREQSTCFLSPKLEGRACGTAGERGVFAREALRAGELLVVFGGEAIDGAGQRALPADRRRFAIQVEEDLYLWSSREGPGDWVNHSCEPNAGLCGQVVLVAMRDIAAGEEITYDYAMSDGSAYDEFDCRCGAQACRGRVSGGDWSNPLLWERYAGYFSPYLQSRIDRQRSAANRRRRRLRAC